MPADSEPRFEREAMRIFVECLEVLCRKRIERGTHNIEKQGITGIVQRMQGDKLERVRVWARHQQLRAELIEVMPQEVIDQYLPARAAGEGEAGDSIADDLRDVANYSVIGVMLLEGVWALPVSSSWHGFIQHLRDFANIPREMQMDDLGTDRDSDLAYGEASRDRSQDVEPTYDYVADDQAFDASRERAATGSRSRD